MTIFKVIPQEVDSTKVPEALAPENYLMTVPEREIPPQVALLSVLLVSPIPQVKLPPCLKLAPPLRC